ncbi:MAG: dihydroorotate dehydrogenase electron transfer subunit [Lachnospiraceae bacterium]|nr:dihydroorotate dehydrogenase electron transfer subunit [Lachnospiraceae bacterium]
MSKMKTKGIVISQNKITPVIYDMWICTEIAKDAKAGQFVGIYPKDSATLLPRPISICEVSKDKEAIRLVYRVSGSGTAEFAAYQQGDFIFLLGVLGNGFPAFEAKTNRVFLIGGGIGIPPLLELAKVIKEKAAPSSIDIFLGYRDNALFLADELAAYGKIHIATEDGSSGSKGNVINAIEESGLTPGVVMACGPLPMLRSVKAYAAGLNIKAYLSLEEHMACGIGACLGCVCRTTEKDHHSHVQNARICTEGPVFDAEYVEI